MNDKLGVFVRDITEEKRIQEERKDIQKKIARLKKMEALGVLAGGVAHELNNVLSGIVSYPDLLLLNLPSDSKLREPISTIQQAGFRAASIVHDLLTLAKKTVKDEEVLNLNDISEEYFASPEFRKQKEHSPHVQFETKLASNLLNIRGSNSNLRKMITNLISNAIEANVKGEIQFATYNRYIDRPLKGYDRVKEGDYAVLEITDQGINLSDHLEKIFDPFYMKRKLSRRGTGLELAVVWQTLQDHKAYVQIESEDYHTKFVLYFPATRETLSHPKTSISLPLKEITGKGEKILIIDDSQRQREIASLILEKLGYQVDSVGSGEAAVEYVKEKKVDLLLLDMIMEPGIDGLDTYKEILKIYPEQKAVIASGFSETERVLEAQKLGAKDYVQKPYTLEKIGMVVRKALDRTSKIS